MKIISACGNDCASCPRFNAPGFEKTEAQLHQTAEMWMRIGYRDRIVSNAEISCTGCKADNWCRYGIVECVSGKGIKHCGQCSDYQCRKTRRCLEMTKLYEPQCRSVCSSKEYKVLRTAFFEKEKNLKKTLAN